MNDKLIILTVVLNLFLLIFATQEKPIVTISQGILKGTILTAKNGRNFSSFLGIPYARPPVGELRFKNPEPGIPWEGIRSADKEANICVQPEEDKVIGNEDCLFLNVHTPLLKFNSRKRKSELLPVMVWIHGGGFFWGNGNPSFHGSNFLLSRDIVFVTLNYRLGILGFLTTGDSEASGNYGLKDQVMALKWIKKNIRNFGGDPDRVTIFGESSGGTSVNLLALSDSTHGLFHRYIIESGNALAPWTFRSRNDAKVYVDTVAKNVGCSNSSSKILVNCFRNQSAEKLINALKVITEDFPILHWLPTNEPEVENAFLTDNPKNLIAQNKMRDLPFIIGSNTDEALFISLLFYTNQSKIPLKDVTEKAILSNAEFYFSKDKIPAFVKAVKDYYFSGNIESLTREELIQNYTRFMTEGGFFYPQKVLLDKMLTNVKSPLYSYIFGYRGNNTYSSLIYKVEENVGVMHSDELLYLFPDIPLSWVTKDDEKIIDSMLDFWTSFATNGKPTSNQLDNCHLWQSYNKCKDYIWIGGINNNTIPSVTLQKEFFPEAMEFWKRNLPLL